MSTSIDVATKKAEAVTAENFEAASPTWSPDGKWIAFMGKEGKDAERYNTWNVYVVEARAGATPAQSHELRRRAVLGFARTAGVEQGWHSPGVPADLRRQAERVQHESPGGSAGRRRRTQGIGRAVGPQRLGAALFARRQVRSSFW